LLLVWRRLSNKRGSRESGAGVVSQIKFRKKALARLAVFCLGTSALTVSALAASFSVGGGTITTTQADASSDSTGTGGPFALQANTVTAGDTITVTGVSIANSSGTPNGRALDVGGLLPSSGSYSATVHGSTLAGGTAAGAWFSSDSGLLSFDSTGGAANAISGAQGLVVVNNVNNGSVSIKTGADTISSSGNGEAVYAVSQGTGTISIDSVGATITGGGIYNIVAVGGSGAITIGGLNGGIASTLNAAGGAGILTISNGTQSITLASSGVINALDGISVMGNGVSIDSFGTINAIHDAVTAPNGTGSFLTVTLESGSATKGRILGGITNDTFNIVAGADITNATFNGGAGTNTLNLMGGSNASFALSSATNISSYQMLGTGIWTLTGSPFSGGGWTIASGTLRAGGNINLNAVIVNGGTFDINGQAVTIGALSGTGGAISLGSGSLTTSSGTNTILASVISGNGSFTKEGAGTLILTGNNSYTGGTTISAGTLQLGDGSIGGIGKVGSGNVVNNGTLAANLGLVSSVLLDNVISGSGNLTKSGVGTLILGGNNTYSGTTTINGGTIIVGNGATGTLGGGDVVNNGALAFNRSNTFTLANNISGTGGLTDNGFGLLIITGTNSYSGQTVSNGGSIQIGAGGTSGSLGTGDVVLGGLANLTFNRSDNITFGGNITGNGGVMQSGSGALILTGNNTYNGGTTIAAGTLQVGNGGASGTLGSSGIVDNGALVFNRSDIFTVINSISGNGSLTQAGTGTLILNSSNTYNGTTTIKSGGTLQVGPGGTNGTLGSGNVVDNGTLNFNHIDSISISNIVSGSGGLGQIGIGTLTLTSANTYTGGTTINSGATLQIGNGGNTGSIVGNVANSGILIVNRSDNIAFGGAISGSGSLTKIATGTLTITGANTYTGGTTISGGTLQIGNNGTSGSLVGSVVDNATLVFNRSDNIAFAGIISGTGSITKLGAGNLTLSGVNTFSGATTVSAGTLSVTGAIASSSVSVASGATLGGTGTVGSTIVASGGTLAPGNSIGTLTVNGNLTLAAGSAYSVEVSPTAADRTMVSGTAGLNGTVVTSVAPGAYAFGQRYTILTATGGVSGSFAALTGIPASLKGQLSYDTSNAYLTLSPNTLAPLLTNPTANRQNLVSAVDAAVTSGIVPGAGFQALYGLSGPALNSALDQISGQVGPNTINAVGQGTLSFLTMTAQGGSNSGNFVPGSAYGAADAPHRAQLGAGEMRVWGSVYGGHVGLSADAASGAASLSSSNVGLIGGADMAWEDGWLAGITAGLGRQNFSSGNGTGNSDDIMIGVYARKDAGPLYVTAAFGYGAHHIETLRVITVSGTDVLQGKQNADDFGGRIEAGWRMALDDKFTLTPYFAVAAESFETPAYAESALSGASTFALSFAAHSSALGRTELGSTVSRNYETENGVLTADLRGAWAHQLDDLPFIQASFQTLPGASFLVTGVRPASDTTLLGAGIQIQNRSGLFFGFKGETQLGAGTTIVEGMGNLGWRW